MLGCRLIVVRTERNEVRKFLVGAYWGGLLACALGLLPIVILQPSAVPAYYLEHLQQMMPALLLAGFALIASLLAAATMLILTELAALRAALDRAATMPADLPARLSNWTGLAPHNHAKATVSCPACRRTNWSEALMCVDCGTPLASNGSFPAH
jgi:hypothetical protein